MTPLERARKLLHELSSLSGDEEEAEYVDIAEAAAGMVENVLPVIAALAMMRQECLDKGLSDETADSLIGIVMAKIVEAAS